MEEYTMSELTEPETAIMYILLGNPGEVVESIHYEIKEGGWRVCITKFEGSEYYNDWSSEMTYAFNKELWEKDWLLIKQEGV